MNISDNYRNLIIKEINYVVGEMSKAKSIEEKLFFFSAIHGMINRVFNLEYDPELLFIHHVLNQTHQFFMARIIAIKQNRDDAIPLLDVQIEKLAFLSEQLGKNIKNKKDINEILKKFIVLSYTTTGNGYYLYQKGLIKI